MSKSGKIRYRWYDEEDDYDSRKKKNGRNRRQEKRLKNNIRSKNLDELSNREKHMVGDWDLD